MALNCLVFDKTVTVCTHQDVLATDRRTNCQTSSSSLIILVLPDLHRLPLPVCTLFRLYLELRHQQLKLRLISFLTYLIARRLDFSQLHVQHCSSPPDSHGNRLRV